MAGFTPGPWIAQPEPDSKYKWFVGIKGYLSSICIVNYASSRSNWWDSDNVNVLEAREICRLQTEANARLIAASPDLYAVCKEIRDHFSYFSEWDLPIGFEDRLNQALAKAEGGS